MRSLIFQLLVVIPTKCNDGEADHCARGGTCFSLAVPVAQANSRSLDCEDRPLCGRSSSLGMTELFSFQIAAWLEAVPFQRPHVVLLTISITRISPDASFVTSNGTMVFIKTVLKKNATVRIGFELCHLFFALRSLAYHPNRHSRNRGAPDWS